MAGRIEPHSDLIDAFIRDIPVAAALLQAGTEDDFEDALTPDEILIEEGDWVTLNTVGEAIKVGGTAEGLAWPVWGQGERYDYRSTKKLTVLDGPIVLATTKFLTTTGAAIDGSSVIGVPLSAVNFILQEAQSGEAIVARLEKRPFKLGNAGFAAGFITINMRFAGGFAP